MLVSFWNDDVDGQGTLLERQAWEDWMEECPREGLQSVKSQWGTTLLAQEERQSGKSLMSQGQSAKKVCNVDSAEGQQHLLDLN